jgi:hypothetical protein
MSSGTPGPAGLLRRSRWLAAAAVGALVLSACGGEASDDANDEASSGNPSPTASVETPEEVEITEPGTQLRYGQRATVDYKIRKQGTVLELGVRSAKQGSLKDFAGFNMADPYQRNANYFYVDVLAKNVGEDPLSKVDVPLWGISGDNTLLPPVRFTSSFKKCVTEPVPKNFRPGKTHRTCLVFLSPNKGTLEGVSYRPVESFDPIEWRGQVKAPVTKAKNKKQRGGKQGNRGGNNGGGDN